jgi:hypothetical protein
MHTPHRRTRWQDGAVRLAFRCVAFVFMGVMLVAAYSFFSSDDRAIEAAARSVACAGRGPKCHAALARFVKTPIYQDRQFRVGSATVDVRCTRTGYLVGDHHCALE